MLRNIWYFFNEHKDENRTGTQFGYKACKARQLGTSASISTWIGYIYIMSHTYILYTGQIANNKEQFYMWWLNFLCYHGNRLSSVTHCSGPRWKPQLQIKPEQSPHLGLLVKSPLNVSYLSLKHLLFFFKRPNHILICLEYESAVDLRYEKTTQWILIGYLGLLVQPPLHVPQLVHQHVLLLLQGTDHVGVGLVLRQKTQHLTRNSHVTHKRFAWHRIYTVINTRAEKINSYFHFNKEIQKL